jgi:hypothetical protein
MDIIGRAGSVLAFVIAFYALAARERKIPQAANAVFSTAALLLLALLFELVGQLLCMVGWDLQYWPSLVSGSFLLAALVLFIYQVFRVRSKLAYLRDDSFFPRNYSLFRWIKAFPRRNQPNPYEHNPPAAPDGLPSEIATIMPEFEKELGDAFESATPAAGINLSVAIGLNTGSLNRADDVLVPLAVKFLKRDLPVQLTTCTRHPIEFVMKLKNHWETAEGRRDWSSMAQLVVVVDAFTPHFGFTDSIHAKFSKYLRTQIGVKCVTSRPSYAGVHTAVGKAFNLIKSEQGKKTRPYTLVIYEGISALADLESREQYRIFLRHVISSERVWGGMLTLLVESFLPPEDDGLLRSYVDVYDNQGVSTEAASGS